MEKLGKHKHILTNILKVGIFSLVMLAPLLAVGFKCLYVACNKNAYQSYSLKQNGEYILVENQTELQENKLYQFNSTRDLYNSTSLEYIYGKEGTFNTLTGTSVNNYPTCNNFRIYYNANNQSYSLELRHNTTNIIYLNFGTYTNPSNISFTFESDRTQNNISYTANIKLIQFGEQTYLDNTFYYAFNQIAEEPLFNWTIETGTYTAINAMMTGLGLSNNHPLTICLCYWFIIMMIYIVVDIIIVCFTKLTHFYSDGE